nr:hypothetical protein [Cytophagales bacterium]
MNLNLTLLIKSFWERNFLERIILYLLFADIIVKIIFELVLGQSSLVQSQHKQWIFYILLLLDYVISFNKVTNIRISINPISLFTILIGIMLCQGLFIGLYSGNKPFELLNDTIPLLMIALNILRLQSATENKPVNFESLFFNITSMAFISCLIGFIGDFLGKPTTATIPLSQIVLPALFTGLLCIKPFPKFMAILFIAMIVLSISEINRTSLAFMLLVTSGYAGFRTISNPAQGFMIIIISLTVLAAGWLMLPEDSKTYRRIIGITQIDFRARTGSIGERAAEYESISRTLERKGKTQKWLGLGFGGLYDFQSTHTYVRDYGHAHYAWAWFKLRFGYLGYIYLALMFAVMLYNLTRGFQNQGYLGIFIALLNLQGILYLGTYVNAIFLCSGLHFYKVESKRLQS